MIYPNFFILGAPKSGTTSLYKYLSEHPNIFMSKIKGPHFFSSDVSDQNRIKTKSEYLELFKSANENHLAIGEASVFYLSSEKAIKKIAKKLPDSKLIIILRNPIDAVQSWHAEMVWSRLEYNENFESAWLNSLNCIKIEKNKNLKLNYQKIFRYGEQINRVFKYFKKNNIKILYYDDYKHNTKKSYADICNFLNVPHVEIGTFIKYNNFKKYKLEFLQNFLTHPPRTVIKILNYVKIKLRIKRIGLFKKLLKFNTFHPKKPKIANHLKKSIIDNYNNDIKNLSKILRKDFNTLWFNNNSRKI